MVLYKRNMRFLCKNIKIHTVCGICKNMKKCNNFLLKFTKTKFFHMFYCKEC